MADYQVPSPASYKAMRIAERTAKGLAAIHNDAAWVREARTHPLAGGREHLLSSFAALLLRLAVDPVEVTLHTFEVVESRAKRGTTVGGFVCGPPLPYCMLMHILLHGDITPQLKATLKHLNGEQNDPERI